MTQVTHCSMNDSATLWKEKHELRKRWRNLLAYNCAAFFYNGNSIPIPLLTLYTSRLFLYGWFLSDNFGLYNGFVNQVVPDRFVLLAIHTCITQVEFTVHLSNLHCQSSPCLTNTRLILTLGLECHKRNKRPGDNSRDDTVR